MDTPDDSQLYRVEAEGKYDSENRSATLHAARRGLPNSAHVDKGHLLTGEFLTSRKGSIGLSPGEGRILQLPPNGGARSVLRESESNEMEKYEQDVERRACFYQSEADVLRAETRTVEVSDTISKVAE